MGTVESANSIVLSPEWVSLSSQTYEKLQHICETG